MLMLQGLPSNPTDLRAKHRKQGGKGQEFHLIKCEFPHCTSFLPDCGLFLRSFLLPRCCFMFRPTAPS